MVKKTATVRHSGAGQNPAEAAFNVVTDWNKAKHVGGLDSALRQNDGVGSLKK